MKAIIDINDTAATTIPCGLSKLIDGCTFVAKAALPARVTAAHLVSIALALFWAANIVYGADNAELKTTASGLRYKILEAGSGPSPKATDTVKVNYRGTLADGTEFDSSYKRGEPAIFPVNRVIEGWVEALQLMKVGSKYQLVIPPDLAYGARAAGTAIGPNATLLFDVELLAINPPTDEPAPSESEAVLQPESPLTQDLLDDETSTRTFVIGIRLTEEERKHYQQLAIKDWNRYYSEKGKEQFLGDARLWKKISNLSPLGSLNYLVKVRRPTLAQLREAHSECSQWLVATYEARYDKAAEESEYQTLVKEASTMSQGVQPLTPEMADYYTRQSDYSKKMFEINMGIIQNWPSHARRHWNTVPGGGDYW